MLCRYYIFLCTTLRYSHSVIIKNKTFFICTENYQTADLSDYCSKINVLPKSHLFILHIFRV